MDYVSEEMDKICRDLEVELATLPEDAGILFVSIQAHPAPTGACTTISICLGIDRRFETAVGLSLATFFARERLPEDVQPLFSIFRGVPGKGK